jgi:predicted nucleic acid-binding Zn finger protein
LQSTYADLAEYYEGDREYAVGTVLVFGGNKEVTQSSAKGDHRVAGVVSENAAYIMNQGCSGNKVLIALQGRVPCRVVGKVKKGDLMITSNISGVAVSAGADAKAGTILGKALQDYESDHIGTIEVAIGRA